MIQIILFHTILQLEIHCKCIAHPMDIFFLSLALKKKPTQQGSSYPSCSGPRIQLKIRTLNIT